MNLAYNLLLHFRDKNIKAAGTIILDRFGKPPFSEDSVLRKKGRGTSEEVISFAFCI